MDDGAVFAIGDLCRIRIRGMARFTLGDLNRKFDHFRSLSREPADLEVDIGPFVPDLSGATNVDHRFFIRRDYVYFRETLPGVSFHAEIQGLEQERTRIRFALTSAPKWMPANLLYPDIHLHSHVLQPLIECKLGGKGRYLLHGAGLAGKGGTTVLVGRGLSFKTTYCMRMVRRGMEFFGDDLLLCDERQVHPFPIHGRFFDFYLGNDLESESQMRGWNSLRMVRHLVRGKPLRYVTAAPSQPDRLIVIHPRQGLAAPVATPLPLETALEKAWLNMKMERRPPEPAKYVIGQFLEAYALVFPDHAHRNHWAGCRAALASLFAGVPAYLLETAEEWRPENLETMRRLLASG